MVNINPPTTAVVLVTMIATVLIAFVLQMLAVLAWSWHALPSVVEEFKKAGQYEEFAYRPSFAIALSENWM
jgi:hypothetical protein